jgi:hypothetical protein
LDEDFNFFGACGDLGHDGDASVNGGRKVRRVPVEK